MVLIHNSDYRAICGEPTKEEVNCVIPWRFTTGDTAFGDVVDLTTGERYTAMMLLDGAAKKLKLKATIQNTW